MSFDSQKKHKVSFNSEKKHQTSFNSEKGREAFERYLTEKKLLVGGGQSGGLMPLL
jgi:hypothetical protein